MVLTILLLRTIKYTNNNNNNNELYLHDLTNTYSIAKAMFRN